MAGTPASGPAAQEEPQGPPAGPADAGPQASTVADSAAPGKDAPLAATAADAGEPAGDASLRLPVEEIGLLAGTEESATSEDEMALLDELLELTLSETPRVLTDEELLLHTPSELPLVINQHVQRLINYFTKTTRGKATIRMSLGRGAAYRPMIERILREEDVPQEIFYLAMAESGFRPKARSHMAAIGMWQFISSRGKQYGLRRDRYLDLRYDPETATRAAAKHLKDLHIEFNDWHLAMAAYNCGPNRVKRAIRQTGSRDYWTLVRRRALPHETRNFVPIILAMAYVGKNTSLFDLGELDPAPPALYDTVRTGARTSFALIADITDSSVETIRDLNHALFQSATPPYAYDLRLPNGSGEKFEREISLIPPAKRLHWRRYEVQPGESLAAVANRYKVKPETLASMNSLPQDQDLRQGVRLTVPTTTSLKVYRYYGGGPAGGFLEPGTGRYRIASGDTLGAIARRFGTTVRNLMSWNGLTTTRIRAGRYLIVRPGGGTVSASASSSVAANGRYTVRRGDTLSEIGSRVGASVGQLRAWNGIRGSTIRIGQVLKVPDRSSASTPAASTPATSTPAAAPSGGRYRIRPGDNLGSLARRFGVSVRDLRDWNGLRSTRITAGNYLVVSRPGTSTGSASTQGSQRSVATDGGKYTVRRGDNLDRIATRHGITVSQLRAWNGLRGNLIHPGQALAVSSPSSTVAGTSSRASTYRVRRGDTLGSIARRHGVTVPQLLAWNGLRTSRIYPGQPLTVGGADSAQ